VLYTPDGREFQTREKRIEELQERLRKVKLALRNAQEAARTDRERSGKDLLAAKLRELGINPDDILTSAS
jgi:hypothetical protein